MGGEESERREFYEIRPSLDKGRPGFYLEDQSILVRGELAFPAFPQPPVVVFDRKTGHLPRDLELLRSFWLVSERTKAVFEKIDPKGFAFVELKVKLLSGDYDGPRYFMCNVIRILDALDEAQSRIKIAVRDDKAYSDFGRKYYSLLVGAAGAVLVFRDGVIGDARIFRMEYLRRTIICDEQLASASKEAKLKGMTFADCSKL